MTLPGRHVLASPQCRPGRQSPEPLQAPYRSFAVFAGAVQKPETPNRSQYSPFVQSLTDVQTSVTPLPPLGTQKPKNPHCSCFSQSAERMQASFASFLPAGMQTPPVQAKPPRQVSSVLHLAPTPSPMNSFSAAPLSPSLLAPSAFTPSAPVQPSGPALVKWVSQPANVVNAIAAQKAATEALEKAAGRAVARRGEKAEKALRIGRSSCGEALAAAPEDEGSTFEEARPRTRNRRCYCPAALAPRFFTSCSTETMTSGCTSTATPAPSKRSS